MITPRLRYKRTIARTTTAPITARAQDYAQNGGYDYGLPKFLFFLQETPDYVSVDSPDQTENKSIRATLRHDQLAPGSGTPPPHARQTVHYLGEGETCELDTKGRVP